MRWLFAVLSVGLFSASVQAQDATSTPPSVVASATDEEARGLYAAGERAFAAGSFERALEHFRHAYELSPRPQLLYNIGLSADRLRRDQEALDAFIAFLATGPDEELRVSLEARVAILRESVAHDSEAPPPPPPPASAPDATGPIALLVTGAVVAVAGAVLLGVAASEDASVQSAAMGSAWSDVRGHHDAAEILGASGGVAIGLGVLAAAGGAIWLATLPSGGGETSVSVGPSGLLVRGVF